MVGREVSESFETQGDAIGHFVVQKIQNAVLSLLSFAGTEQN
jgi:hypothetical protein